MTERGSGAQFVLGLEGEVQLHDKGVLGALENAALREEVAYATAVNHVRLFDNLKFGAERLGAPTED